jgi:hypothetical protein
MKRSTQFVLLAAGALATTLGVLSGCSNNRSTGDSRLTAPVAGTGTGAATATGGMVESVPGVPGQLRLGLGIATSLDGSTSASGEDNGQVQSNSVIAAITLDSNGVITRASFDAAQTRVAFDSNGQLVTDVSVPPRTKTELGDEYGMRRASGIGKEYNEQLVALENWAVGRTPAQFVSMALSDGRPADADLTASVTFTVGNYLTAMERAVSNLRSGAAPARFRTGLGVSTDTGASASATAAQAGKVQISSSYVVLTMDENDRIVAAWIDSTQPSIPLDASGNLGTIPEDPPTRFTMGNAHGMRGASGIGREWFEQMGDLANWMIGKTPTEVLGMGLNNGHATDADLTASVTVSMTSILTAVAKAAENAR